MSIQIGSVTINRNPSFPLNPNVKRFNQEAHETADAGFVVYDNGPEVINGVIIIKRVAKAEGDALKTYIRSTAIFQKNTFTISPPANTDVGAGDGVALTGCNYTRGDFEGVFDLQTPGLYIISFPYRKKV